MTTARLAFEKVACLRGGRLLFEGRSFALEPGQAGLLTGPNGVGKSSLLRMAAGLLAPAAGRIERDGAIAFTAEAAALDIRDPLETALRFWAKLDGGNRDDVARAMAALAIAPLAQVPVRMLSTGQRKRAVLARVIASQAEIWLLDEPGNGLDAASLDRLAVAMAAHRSAGGIVLAATHQPLGLVDPLEIAL